MHFKSLRLQGFKSFVEPTELRIDAGMTGIVGPNGCGKSNLVEALRWVMGETSPKRMRGAEMDDVIFAGTATRPSRNVAEVQLKLDNAARTAGPAFNDSDDLMLMRQIERGNGSDYRINGKPVRQKDVQLLFADHATGAHSTSVIGQGQIDALIRAKPQDRRQILEEASGTSGLQSRRHEAELKLKSAEQNLARADDVLKAYDGQIRGLRQQVKQASRYRNLADHIRRTEAALLHLKWLEAEKEAEAARLALEESEKRVAELTLAVTAAEAERTGIAADLPEKRTAEAEAAAAVQHQILRRERLEAEAKRVEGETLSLQNRLVQAGEDMTREEARRKDGTEALQRLTEEETQIATRAAEIETALPAAEESLATAVSENAALEAALEKAVHEAAHADARQKALAQESANLAQRRLNLAQRRAEAEAAREALAAERAAAPNLALALSMVEACETELARRESQAGEAEKARQTADQTLQQRRDMAHAAHAARLKLEAEADALSALLRPEAEADEKTRAVLDFVTVSPGLEKALAVALGDALTAALDVEAARHWRELPPIDGAPLPQGTEALSGFIQAPPALSRALSQIGFVENAEQGASLAAALRPGQILVSRDGWAWRWDGFTVTPRAPAAAALRLEQRNRLAALQVEMEAAQKVWDDAREAEAAATAALNEARALDETTRSALHAASAALRDARDLHAARLREGEAAAAKMQNIEDSIARLVADDGEIETRLTAVEAERQTLPDIAALRRAIETQRAEAAEKRGLLVQKQADRDRFAAEFAQLTARRTAIANEQKAWNDRTASAASQIASLEERAAAMQAQLDELLTKPALLSTERSEILDALTAAELAHREAADAVLTREQTLAAAEVRLKRDEQSLAAAREERVRQEGAAQAVTEHFNSLRERMTEKLNCGPEELPAQAELKEGEELPNLFELDQTLARYNRERDNMGPVNLRAEVEAETLQQAIDKLTTERDDLTAAIAKLRQGITALNREARERLQTAFTAVNERFEKLFKQLFNGGRAELQLIDNEDPMNAGLEIIAAPPGKKQQVLSLLSGGERTLTAIALVFAVFQTNPSPICVLDEAEAALDESNIGRFCDLIETIAKETGTRFLIITHHRLTMARMHRLYGVTMGEKGVSQLVSVDLDAAVAMRESTAPRATEALKAVQAA